MRDLKLPAVAAALLSLMFSASSPGATPVDPVNKDRGGVALHGFDAVAYFKEGKPVRGSAQFTYQWMGANWRFASAEARDLFAADPARYAPQYGGYCAWAVSQGYTADIDPNAWKIVDGKLYLNYDRGVQKKWHEDAGKRIEDADKNWPRLHR